jgi:hypothetical protein
MTKDCLPDLKLQQVDLRWQLESLLVKLAVITIIATTAVVTKP